MNQLIRTTDGVTMSSLEMVDYINSMRGDGDSELRHDHFMAKVPKVLGESLAPKFLGTNHYTSGKGVVQSRAIYTFPKREACLMAMSYSYDLQAKVFDYMTELENAAQSSQPVIPQTYAEALRLAADMADQKNVAEAKLLLAKPKLEFVERYVNAEGSKSFREVAKLLGLNEITFRTMLFAEGVMYRLNGALVAYQKHIDANRFTVKAGVSEFGHAYNHCRFTPKGIEWVAGLIATINARRLIGAA